MIALRLQQRQVIVSSKETDHRTRLVDRNRGGTNHYQFLPKRE